MGLHQEVLQLPLAGRWLCGE